MHLERQSLLLLALTLPLEKNSISCGGIKDASFSSERIACKAGARAIVVAVLVGSHV